MRGRLSRRPNQPNRRLQIPWRHPNHRLSRLIHLQNRLIHLRNRRLTICLAIPTRRPSRTPPLQILMLPHQPSQLNRPRMICLEIPMQRRLLNPRRQPSLQPRIYSAIPTRRPSPARQPQNLPLSQPPRTCLVIPMQRPNRLPNLPQNLRGGVAFFDVERYNPAATVQDNILFGKTAHGQAMAVSKITGSWVVSRRCRHRRSPSSPPVTTR